MTDLFVFGFSDLIAVVAAAFVLGVMAGHKWLPKPIDWEKEKLIDILFKENMSMKLQGLHRKFEKGDADASQHGNRSK